MTDSERGTSTATWWNAVPADVVARLEGVLVVRAEAATGRCCTARREAQSPH